MRARRIRSSDVLYLSAASFALLAVTAAAPASAQTCDGKPATIVGSGIIEGTPGRDVIVGSDGDDTISGLDGRGIICGRKGKDVIDGGKRRDRIFGGGGDDILGGGNGPDDLFGYRGNDLIFGQEGNDFINGGSGTDSCYSGPVIKNCEKADLKITITGPGQISFIHEVNFEVKVRNRGPQPAAYVLILEQLTDQLSCTPTTNWDGVEQKFKKLAPKRTRKRTYVTDCTPQAANGWVKVKGEVYNHADDPNEGNNKDKERAIWAD